MIEFLDFFDKREQQRHFEDLAMKNPEKLSEAQKDFMLLERLKEQMQNEN